MSDTPIELPLFPLNVVLFPGTVLPLHIFEPRYRLMIADCLKAEKPFGVVLARPESEHLHEVTYDIGTMAKIHQLDRLEDGRFNLVAIGTQRFRILSQHHEKAYLSGIVEAYQDKVEMAPELLDSAELAFNLFSSYLEILLETTSKQDLQAELPPGAEELSFLIAYLLDVTDEQKQLFLELTSTHERLKEEITILRREVPFIRQMLLRNERVPEPLDRSMLN